MKELAAYVVAAPGAAPDPVALRRSLSESLPDYMLPGAITVLEALPLTPNGKLDRRALPAPQRRLDGFRAPQTADETLFCEAFAHVLSLDRVGAGDNFFALGGHSLLATRLVSWLRSEHGLELPLRILFEAPTPADLAAHLLRADPARPLLARRCRPEHLPLSNAQQRLWFIDQLQGSSGEYNMPQAIRLSGLLDIAALQRAIDAIVERHEILRTRFATHENEPVQIISPALEIPLSLEDVSTLDPLARQERVADALRIEWELPFDLANGPLLRGRVLRLTATEHVVLLTFHHIVFDGWSQSVLNRELVLLYDAFREGRQNPLAELPIQYADFTLWQREWLNQELLQRDLEYWKLQLADVPDELRVPRDRARQMRPTHVADLHRIAVPPAVVAALKELSQTNQATIFMTMLAALGVLLARYSGQDDVVIGSPIANRQDTRLEQLIGLFVNSLVLRIRVAPEMTFENLLADVRDTALGAYQHQDLAFERLVEELSPQRALNKAPLFQIVFALHNAPVAEERLKDLNVESLTAAELRVRVDLEIHAIEDEGAIELNWLYSVDLFDRWRIEQMARHYVRLLEAVASSSTTPLRAIAMVDEDERSLLLTGFNPSPEEPAEQTFSNLFDTQAAQTPDAVAVAFGQDHLTYRQLQEAVDRFARHLVGRGVGPEKLVGICLERSIDAIVAVLGTLKAGGAYLPLDPSYPPTASATDGHRCRAATGW